MQGQPLQRKPYKCYHSLALLLGHLIFPSSTTDSRSSVRREERSRRRPVLCASMEDSLGDLLQLIRREFHLEHYSSARGKRLGMYTTFDILSHTGCWSHILRLFVSTEESLSDRPLWSEAFERHFLQQLPGRADMDDLLFFVKNDAKAVSKPHDHTRIVLYNGVSVG